MLYFAFFYYADSTYDRMAVYQKLQKTSEENL